MKKQLLLIICVFFLGKLSGQILCIQCYQQNDSVYAGGVNLIQNGGFENTTCLGGAYFCPNSGSYSCNISNWLCSGGGTNTYAQMANTSSAWAIIIQGTKAAYLGNQYCQVCSTAQNDTSCYSNMGCEINGIPSGYPSNTSYFGGSTGVSLEQTVTGLTAGSIYVLEFWAGGEYSYAHKGIFAVDVGFGKTMLSNKSTQPITGIGTRYNIVFTATSSSHTIKFTNWGHVCVSCTEIILDDVKLYEWNSPSSPCLNVGTTELPVNTISIYPNPATDQLTVNSEQSTIKEIKIMNVMGQVVFQSTISINQSTIDIKNYEQGIYFVEIKSGEGVIRKKFIIVK